MSKKHERIARVEGIDESTGVFTMTLATEGEASDGHILSIKGGNIPERMPLLVSHYNEPTSQAGSITDPQKALKDSPPRLRATGRIEMSGEGPSAEIRRDLAHMIARGHISGMSIRWDEVPGKTMRRINLPADHPYYVDPENAKGAEKWGLYFEEWRALEGSIVSIGADPQALIGRAEETQGEVSSFWRAMASDLEEKPHEFFSEPEITMELEEPSEEAKQAAALASVRAEFKQALDLGLEMPEILREIGAVVESIDDSDDQPEDDEPSGDDLLDRVVLLEERFAALEEGRVEPDAPPASPERVEAAPLAALDAGALGRVIASAVMDSEQRITRKVQSILDRATGKVTK